MQVGIHGLIEDQQIRCFVELPKLFELLIRERVFFSTLATFQAMDPFECRIALPQAARKMSRIDLKREAHSLLKFLEEKYQTGNFAEDYRRHEKLLDRIEVRELRQHVTEMRLMLLKRRIVCSCWHLSENESDAMWKLYGNRFGVMIVSNIKSLKEAIKGQYSSCFCAPNPQEYLIAPIKYINERSKLRLPDFYVQRPWLLKRASFAHEHEIRVSHELAWMAFDPNAAGMLIDIDPRKLIKEIVLSPFSPVWANKPVSEAIEVVLGAKEFTVPVRVSEHMKSPTLKSEVLASLEFLKLRDMLGGRRPHVGTADDDQSSTKNSVQPSVGSSRSRKQKAKITTFK